MSMRSVHAQPSPAFAVASEAALDNIAAFGDTDIFPPPFEIGLFDQARPEVLEGLTALSSDFYHFLRSSPPTPLRMLVPAGTGGYRLATQLDPIWNAYYLTLVIRAGAQIEASRQPVSALEVFSYRFGPQAKRGRIFDQSGWRTFLETVERECARQKFVIVTDLSDFYHRITWSTLEKCLRTAAVPEWIALQLGALLNRFEIDQFGLPVGGPASRLLAELVLVEFDRTLAGLGVRFCRYVDDIRIFCDSESQAHQVLMAAATALWRFRLSLQKAKTRIIPAGLLLDEMSRSRLSVISAQQPDGARFERRQQLGAFAETDPYTELSVKHDMNHVRRPGGPAVGDALRREFSKSQVSFSTVRALFTALGQTPWSDFEDSFAFLFRQVPTHTLTPVLGRLMTVLDRSIDDMPHPLQERMLDLLASRFLRGRMDFLSNLHAMQVVRTLSRLTPGPDLSLRDGLRHIAGTLTDPLVMRELMFLWANWGWFSDLGQAISRIASVWGPWEARALGYLCKQSDGFSAKLRSAGPLLFTEMISAVPPLDQFYLTRSV